MPEVSIVIPAYNGARYLDECLRSAVHQTFFDIEIVVVDDCSTDSTWELVREFSRRDSRMRIHRNPSRLGLVRNWNRSMLYCSGQWIKFLFQDDVLNPMCIEKMLDAAEKGKAEGAGSFVVCERQFIFEQGLAADLKGFYETALTPLGDIFPGKVNVLSHDFSQTLLENGVGNNFVGEPSSVMMGQDLCVDYGFFNPNLVHLCDLEYWTRIATNEGMMIVPERLSDFRVHPGSASVYNHAHRQFELSCLDRVVLLHDYLFHPLYEKFRSQSTDETKLKTLLMHELDVLADVSKEAFGPDDRMRCQTFLAQYPILKVISEA